MGATPTAAAASAAGNGSRSVISRIGQILSKATSTADTSTITSNANLAPHAMKLVRPAVLNCPRWNTIQINIPKKDANRTIADVICQRYAVSFSMAQRFIRDGKVCLHRAKYPQEVPKLGASLPPIEAKDALRRTVRENSKVLEGDLVTMSEVRLAPRQTPISVARPVTELSEEQQAFVQRLVLYKDERIIVLNKPAGLAMHGGPKVETHLAALLDALKFGNAEAPLIVHRLDRETSGALVLARTRTTAAELASRFRDCHLDGRIKKIYWALCLGKPDKRLKQGRIVSNLYRIVTGADARMTSFADRRRDLTDEGVPAVTQYRWMQLHRRRVPKQRISLMELVPLTGRTHQLRVHLAEQLRLPILGDYKYHPRQPAGAKLHLHCYRIELTGWLCGVEGGGNLVVKAPIPEHFVQTMTEAPMHLRKVPKFPKMLPKNVRSSAW